MPKLFRRFLQRSERHGAGAGGGTEDHRAARRAGAGADRPEAGPHLLLHYRCREGTGSSRIREGRHLILKSEVAGTGMQVTGNW